MQEIPSEKLKQKISSLNPHWKSGKIDSYYEDMKQRRYFDLFFPLVNLLDAQRAVVLMGPRRVGKTVMLWHSVAEFIKRGAKPKEILYVSLDTPILSSLSLDDLLSLYLEIHEFKSLDDKIIIFDEIQYLKDWDVQLKSLTDLHKKTKFVVSGSAAGALKMQSLESGAGRFSDFLLPPLTFFEYLDLLSLVDGLVVFHDQASSSSTPVRKGIDTKDIEKLNAEFINYLNYGGFPEAIFIKAVRDNPHRFIQSDILDKVLLRDLPSLYGISDTQELYRLFSTLAYHTGDEVTYEKLSQESGVAVVTIKKYIEYLEAAFLIKTVMRISDSGKHFRRANFFKVYLTNPSLYAALFDFVSEDDVAMGRLVETAIYSQWMHHENSLQKIKYARWNKGEVDITYSSMPSKIDWCVEVKWSDRYVEKPAELKSLIQFCKNNALKKALVTTKSKTEERFFDSGLKFEFVPSALYCCLVGRNSIKNKKLRNTPIGGDQSRTLKKI